MSEASMSMPLSGPVRYLSCDTCNEHVTTGFNEQVVYRQCAAGVYEVSQYVCFEHLPPRLVAASDTSRGTLKSLKDKLIKHVQEQHKDLVSQIEGITTEDGDTEGLELCWFNKAKKLLVSNQKKEAKTQAVGKSKEGMETERCEEGEEDYSKQLYALSLTKPPSDEPS